MVTIDNLQWHDDIAFVDADGTMLTKTANFISLQFAKTQRVLSSAVMNGGMGECDYFLNLKVAKTVDKKLGDKVAKRMAKKVAKDSCSTVQPAESLRQYADQLALKGRGIGMMTAASMNSFRVCRESVADKYIAAYVTSGLDNLRCVGDQADVQSLQTQHGLAYEPDTINLLIKTNLCLSDSALVEAIAMANETKAMVMIAQQRLSPISHRVATGTGTDATAIVCDSKGPITHYIGKHVIEGQMLARAVEGSLSQSLLY